MKGQVESNDGTVTKMVVWPLQNPSQEFNKKSTKGRDSNKGK